MSFTPFESSTPLPSEEFTRQVKELLEHLHDFGFLRSHPLSMALEATGASHSESGWEFVRKELLLAVESLSPGANPPISSPRARSYHILNLHYLEEIPLQQCTVELGISLRQTNRELRRAEQSVAAILWSRFGERLRQNVERKLAEPVNEYENLKPRFEPIDMALLIHEICLEVEPLAKEHACRLILPPTSEPQVVFTDSMISRQALISIYSRLIQTALPGDIRTDFFTQADTRGIQISLMQVNPSILIGEIEPFVKHLLQLIEWKLDWVNQNPLVCRLTFELNDPPTLLVIDDNEGLGLLLERYLSGRRCRLVTARSGVEGLALAAQLEPDAVLLDVMMPGMDGWQVLNRLKNEEITQEIPVIVCSVFNDPRLARSLGAALLLPKPLNRDDFLTAIRQVGL